MILQWCHRCSLPEAELKRVLGEGGVHGLEEVGDHVEGSWEDKHLLFGVVVSPKKKQHIVALGCSKKVVFFCWFLFCGHKDFEDWEIRGSPIEIVVVWGDYRKFFLFFWRVVFSPAFKCVFVYLFGCQRGMSPPPNWCSLSATHQGKLCKMGFVCVFFFPPKNVSSQLD